jgi:hypothetical protein
MYRTVTAGKLLAFAELVLDPKSYTTLGSDASEHLAIIIEIIGGRRWVENLTIAITKLVAASVSLLLPVQIVADK